MWKGGGGVEVWLQRALSSKGGIFKGEIVASFTSLQSPPLLKKENSMIWFLGR